MKTVHKTTTSEQPVETEATETPERVLLREILEVLDIPRPAHYDDRALRQDLLEGRVAFILGYVGAALESDTIEASAPGLTRSVSERFPVAYKARGGGSL